MKMFGARVDGSLRFDTRVDSGGFNTGVKNLGGSLGRLRSSLLRVASAVGLAFSVATVINFGRTCIQTATEVENAWIGLNSIINGQGKSFENAKKFLQEYISDGLVPLKNAVTAYKNLSLRGYNEEQIKAVMNSLKNSATYARQSQYTLGDAITTATEGLKNENSILVDNAGVTKNVAKMWQDYAKSIGVSSTSLTKQQKIQAEVNGILEETKFQMGDASRYSNSYSGQLARLSASFTALKTKIGNILKVIVGNFLPSINNAISAVERLADKVTALFNSWGIQTDIVDSLKGITDIATDSTDSLTDSIDETSEATEKLKNQLASFDKLNVLKQEDEETTTPATSSTGELNTSVNVGVDSTQAEQSASLFTIVFDKLNKVLQPVIEALGRLKEALKPLKEFSGKALESFYTNFLEPVGNWVINEGLPRFIDSITEMVDNINWDKINMALENFWKVLEPFSENVGEGLLWFTDNVLSPLGTWVINDVVPNFLDILSGALDVLSTAIDTVKPVFKWLWDNFLSPIAEWTGGVIVSVLDGIGKALQAIADVPEAVIIIESLVAGFVAWKLALIAVEIATKALAAGQALLNAVMNANPIGILITVLGGLIAAIILLWNNCDWFRDFWINAWNTICEAVKKAWTSICKWLSGLWSAIVDWFKSVWDGIKNIFSFVADWFKDVFTSAWQGIKNAWSGTKEFFSNVWTGIKNAFGNVANWFKTTFKNAWEAVKNVFSTGSKIFEGIKEGISSVFKTVVNGLIDGINTIISAPFNKINEMLNTIRNVEAFGAKPFEFMWSENPLPVPQIPKLATGTVVPANYGEFTAILGDNKREPEIVSPLSTMKQAMREVFEEMSVSQNNNGEIVVVLELDSDVVFKKTVQKNNQHKKRYGKSAFA